MIKYFILGFLIVFGSISACSSGTGSPEQLFTLRGSSVVVVLAPNKQGGGTGFAARARSGTPVIVTNSHVCEAKDKSNRILIAVNEDRKKTINASVIIQDQEHDLCLITGVPVLDPFSITTPIIGEPVTVIGYPLLEPLNMSTGNVLKRVVITLITGIRPNEAAECDEGEEKRPKNFFIPPHCTRNIDSYNMSTVVHPGNSGSPVINRDGNVVGVIFAGNNQSNLAAMTSGEHLIKLLEKF